MIKRTKEPLAKTFLIISFLFIAIQYTQEAYFVQKVTSALSEGLNNKISSIQKRAYGYRDLDYFILKIYQQCGAI